MDATPTPGDKKAPPPTADAPRRAQKAEPSSPGAAAGGGGGGAETICCGGDDDEVERFYALLDNIRAMRAIFNEQQAGLTATATGRKRARGGGAEPPWRPAFRMEDFDLEEGGADADDAVGRTDTNKKKKKKESRSCLERRPAAGAGAGDEEDGEVVEANGGVCGVRARRGAARGSVDQLASS